eukprot:CAMPEP_0176025860 /NCGR_PEP_ID=MMETSP0120_2-20121206/12659_1 /TAXON_ID=160619 /ORGANISM="Kryptoperidinium foliaceum, Strain CCMP 1326" /LENGTH=1800 /DNA_ID=CAMNT_0017359051 /DNA_START=49 /DNA_END=5451 /DNA_ORIENTATION=-
MISVQTDQARPAPQDVRGDLVLKEACNLILKEAPKKFKDLRDQCTADLERLGKSAGSVILDDYVKVLRLALEAQGSPKVVAIALDVIHKLTAAGQLSGKGPDPFNGATPSTSATPRALIDAVVEAVTLCADQADDNVQVRQMQTLLALSTSQNCKVHGSSLMLSVSHIFKICRDTKSAQHQKQAHTCLSQMLTTVMQRMELSSQSFVDASRQRTFTDDGAQATATANAELRAMPPGQLLNEWMSSYLNVQIDKVVMEQGGTNGEAPGKFGWCIVCRKPALHYCVDTKDPVCDRECKHRNLERLRLVEASCGMSPAGEASATAPATIASSPVSPAPAKCNGIDPSEVDSALAAFVGSTDEMQMDAFSAIFSDKAINPYHRDALLLLSFFCKQSLKDVPPPPNDQRAIRSKKISLELVYAMLQHCGPVCRSSKVFIQVLKKVAVVSLIKNSVSPIQKIFTTSIGIFGALLQHFKENLRAEIGICIEQVFLRILESGNSSYLHKHRVLQVFYQLCTDATTALELFLNFDCDVDEKNIFERMIDCLSKIAQGKYTSLEHSNLIQPQQEQELKVLALKALVTLMGSIVDWARRMTEEKPPTTIGDAQVKADADSDGEDDTKSNSTLTSAATGVVSAVSPATSSVVDNRQRKMQLQVGVNKFNMKPKRGIEYLKQHSFISDDPHDVSELFRKGDMGFDKTAIGDYLGEDKPYNKAVLYGLVDGCDFRGQELDVSLRGFLSMFRLPGEAQKIDRMMEKFAEKYALDNPGVFENADCAFVLSFSLIMLQTDLHNENIRNRMTKDEFVRNNRGINNGADLPREYLEKLYDGVQNNPISLKEDEEAKHRLETQAAQSASQKHDLFVRETESMVQRSQEILQTKGGKISVYVAARSVEHIRPLFEVACWPYLATLAVLLEMSDDNAGTIELCVEGFKHCIRIAARFDMDTERDAFVSSLAKFTYLITLKEMKQKNIECIKALLNIGMFEGNNLGPSWHYVLTCLSQLERYELIGSHRKQDFTFFRTEDTDGLSTTSPSQSFSRTNSMGSKNTESTKWRAHGLGVSALVALGADDRNKECARQVELVNSESIVAQIDSAQIERLFNKSTQLSATAIVHFVTQLARVSKEELDLVEQPRIFSLQKLVEVADYNMARARLDWQKIWRVLAKHFVEVASHPNKDIGMYGIDSLRQLSSKFLDKEELANFQFQAEFLAPFENIMVNCPGVSRDVKEYVVNIIAWMVENKKHNIKSGWKTVFHIVRAAALENHEPIEKTAFEIVETILDSNQEVLVETFVDGVQALLAFGQSKSNMKISQKAIKHLLQAADKLAEKTKELLQQKGEAAQEADEAADPQGMKEATSVDASRHPAEQWLHILRGLSSLISDLRREVRSDALSGLFECLQKHGSSAFDQDTWRMVFNSVIKPLFDDIHHQLQDQRKQEGAAGGAPQAAPEGTAASWAAQMGRATCLQALTSLVRLFSTHLESLSFLLDDVLKIVRSCITHDNEAVARIGVEGLKQLLKLTGTSMSEGSWLKVTDCVKQLFAGSMPVKLMTVEANASGEAQLPFRRDDVVVQCIVQLLLIDMLQETITQHYEHIPPAGVMALLDALQSSFEFAQDFNQRIELRQTLKRMGFIREMKQLPGLLKQEREALSCSLKVLFQVQADARMLEGNFASKGTERLMRLCTLVLRNYVNKERILQEQADAPVGDQAAEGSVAAQDREAATVEIEREVLGLVPIISDVVMRGLRDLEPEQFSRYAPDLFPLLCELVIVNSREVREKVREVMLRQVGPRFGVPYEEQPPDAEACQAAETGS